MSGTKTNSNNSKNNNFNSITKNNSNKNNIRSNTSSSNTSSSNTNSNNTSSSNTNSNNTSSNINKNNTSSNTNINNTKKNNYINNFYNQHKDKIVFATGMYEASINRIIHSPLQIKILNTLISLGITFLFTNIQYNLTLSIIFAILTTFTIFVFGRYYGLIFLILYVIYVNKIISSRNLVFVNFIGNTDISNNGPLDCSLLENQKIIPTKDYKNNVDSSSSFTYSMWLFVNNSNSKYPNNWNNYRYNEWKSILYAGDSKIQSSDTTNLNQYPGFWMTPKLNNIVVTFQTSSNKVDRFEVKNFPMNEWFNLTCVVERNSVSIYINCEMQNNFNLNTMIPGDYTDYNLYVANDSRLSNELSTDTKINKNGFPGLLGNLAYYNYALNQTDINMLCKNYNQKFKDIQNKDNKNNNNSCKSSCILTDSDTTNLE